MGVDFRHLNRMKDLQKCHLYGIPTYDRYIILGARFNADKNYSLSSRAYKAAYKLARKIATR